MSKTGSQPIVSESDTGANSATDADDDTILRVQNVSKHYGGVVALEDVSLSIRENEVLSIVGDNGAGKSTFIKTLVGLHTPNEGEYYFRGETVNISSPKVAQRMGIATVHQDLGLVDELSVAANIFLGHLKHRKLAGVVPIVNWPAMNEEAERILAERLDIHLDPEARVEFLSGGERQAVAIARALTTNPELIIMDEPTSALSAAAAQRVEALVESLQEQGETILIVDHNLDEVFSLCDRLAVLHNGTLITTVDAGDVTQDQIVHMMVSGSPPPGLDVDPATVA